MKHIVKNYVVYLAAVLVLVLVLCFFLTHPVGPRGLSQSELGQKDRIFGGTCSGETKLLRKCMPGYNQACVNNIPCECEDGWKFITSSVDGCVQWSGKDIPDNANRYAFPDECSQVCRGSGSIRAQ